MYDAHETETSKKYMYELLKHSSSINIALIGGWAAYIYVNSNYRKAFGLNYLMSRDIDVFIDVKHEKKFADLIKNLGFQKSAYPFRYEIIYDKVSNKIITQEQAKKQRIFNLFYIFLDLFSNKPTKLLGTWCIGSLNNSKRIFIDNIPILDINSLILLKTTSFFEREKLDKELKDACDLYALVFYSEQNLELTELLKHALDKILNREDLCEFISEQVLRDSLKAGIVKRTISNYLSNIKTSNSCNIYC